MREITAHDMRKLGKAAKIVVLLERKPLSDVFEQLMLTEAQYRRVCDLVWSMMPPTGDGNVLVTLQPEVAVTIKNSRDVYTQAEIDASPDELQ